jgi:hypothetical protein
MKKYIILVLFNIAISVFAVAQKHKKVVNQGISGIVLWQSGNQMPSPDAPATTAKGSPVQREVYIYELTNQKQADASAMPFFSKITTKLIAKVKTGKDGKFKIKLPVGYYSIFTKEAKGLYANQFDDSTNIFAVQVTRHKWSGITFLIDYQAAY